MAKRPSLTGTPARLALARKLGLTEGRLQQVTTIHDRMNAAARVLGGELITLEQAFGELFCER